MKGPGRPPRVKLAERPEWARRLVEFRKQAKLSQAALARIAKIGQSTLADYETGATSPSLMQMQLIAAALDKRLTDFFDGPEGAPTEDLGEHVRSEGQSISGDMAKLDGAFAQLFEGLWESQKKYGPKPLRPSAVAMMTRSMWRLLLDMDRDENAPPMDERVRHALRVLEAHVAWNREHPGEPLPGADAE